MSKPRETEREQRELQSVVSADLEPTLDAEVIVDLDVAGEAADNVLGGLTSTKPGCTQC